MFDPNDRITLLTIEDEPGTASLLRDVFSRDADVLSAPDGRTGLELAFTRAPDVILLDVRLPEMNGLEVCRRLRAHRATRDTPVLILSAEIGEADRVVGLELGADDYVTKPFSPRELRARVQAILRRHRRAATAPAAPEPVLRHGLLIVDLARRAISYDGAPLPLTSSEFRIVALLAAEPGRVRTRDEIGTASGEGQMAGDERSVDAHVRRIRAKMGPGALLIETVRGFGYRMLETPPLADAA